MLQIHEKDVIYRCIGDDFNEGVIACGYMPKPTSESSQYHFVTGYYSGFILLSGTGTFIEENGTQYTITPGCFVQRFPGHVHSTRIHPDGQWLEFFVCLGKSVYEYMSRLNMLPLAPVSQSPCDIDNSAMLCGTFDHFMAQLKTAKRDELYMLLPDIQKLVLTMSMPEPQAHRAAAGGSGAAPKGIITYGKLSQASDSTTSSAIRSACDTLSSNFTETIDFTRLAASHNMSYETFRKQFTRQTGMPPAHYRNQQRIRHAQLLLSSGISIKETAQMTGYGDTYAFTKQFVKIVGMPPGRYVRELQEMLQNNP